MSKQCATCRHFRIHDDKGELLPGAEQGIGRCHGYDGYVAPVEPFVRFDAPFCVHYTKSKNIAERQRYIEEQMTKEST